jgi:hypothetical protein
MAWDALASAGIGAVLALSGTLLADVRRDRRVRLRDRDLDRRRYCVDFLVAMARGHGALRAAASTTDAILRRAQVAEAMEPLYVAREQMLVSGTAALVTTGEETFQRLVAVRDAIRGGAPLASSAYHDAYHSFAEALWRFRLAARDDLHEPALTPGDLDRPDWTDRESCSYCTAQAEARP